MAYLGKTPSQAVRSRYYFTASGGETSLSGTDDNGNTLTYTDGNYVDVSLNGVALVAGSDYNTTTANTIGGLTALTASDVVEVVVYDTFSVFSGAFTGDISLGDNVKAKFGAGDDLQIYHDGSNSYVQDTGTGDIIIKGDNVRLQDSAGGNLLVADVNDAVKLYYGYSEKLATTSTGIDVTGTVTADGLTVDVPSGNGAINFNVTDGNQASFIFKEANVQKWNVASVGSDDRFQIYNYNINGFGQTIAANNDVSFYDSTGVTQGLFWDASTQRLGLGTTGPAAKVDIKSPGATSTALRVLRSDATANLHALTEISGHGRLSVYDGSENEDIRLDSNGASYFNGGDVGIGLSSGIDGKLHVAGNTIVGDSSTTAFSSFTSGGLDVAVGSGTKAFQVWDDNSTSTPRFIVERGGNVAIGQTSANQKLDVNGSIVADAYSQGAGAGIFLRRGFESTAQPSITVQDHSGSAPDGLSVNGNDGVSFRTSNTERARFDGNGHFLVAKTTAGASNDGFEVEPSNGATLMTRTNNPPLVINRLNNDGTLVIFRQQNTDEGSISVSGTTVSYNGGHLARWSQLADNTKDTSIVKGTVMTNLDQMAVWTKDGVTEDNEQLNCMAVSSVEGDANVAGVFVNWDDDDEDYTADMNIAMTGDMVIRIAQGTTVARGDLLMSAGDGTAKPQGDDIVRSKTIAKVTSTTVSHTYDDGSYLVPCVLMAC